MASRKSRNTILPLLERLARAAPEGSDASLFAHRHLAEYLVEQHPWRALVHLRRVLGPARPPKRSAPSGHAADVDDGAHALAGLAHALLGNYHSAAEAYRRAIGIAPRNPWYQHNLGHLLDVGLDRPKVALRHLEAAHRAAGPDDGEISASLAHCLARLGDLSAALGHVDVAIATCPDNPEHRRLREWILGGAQPRDSQTKDDRAGGDVPTTSSESETTSGSTGGSAIASASGSTSESDTASSASASPAVRPTPKRIRKRKSSLPGTDGHAHTTAVGRPATGRRRAARVHKIAALIEARMEAAGHAREEVEHASRLWEDYAATLPAVSIRRESDDLWVALTEYAISSGARGSAKVAKPRAPSIPSFARRHGVSSEALSRTWAELETVLLRWARDPSYARS